MPQILQRDAAVGQGRGIVRAQLHGLPIAGQSRLGLIQFLQHDAAVVQCLREIRPHPQRLAITLQRLQPQAQFAQGIAPGFPDFGQIRRLPERPIVVRQRFVGPSRAAQRIALRDQGFDRCDGGRAGLLRIVLHEESEGEMDEARCLGLARRKPRRPNLRHPEGLHAPPAESPQILSHRIAYVRFRSPAARSVRQQTRATRQRLRR